MATKVVILTMGTKGDLYPFLGIAREMKARGYEPVIVTSEHHRSACQAAGIEMESVLPTAVTDVILNDPGIWKPIIGLTIFLKRMILASMRDSYRVIEKYAAQSPVIVVHSSIVFAGLIAREKLNVPTLSVVVNPYSRLSIVDTSKENPLSDFLLRIIGVTGRRLAFGLILKFINFNLRDVNVFRRKLALPPVKDPIRTWRNAAPHIIDLWPEWFCKPKVDWPTHVRNASFIEYDGSPGSPPPISQENPLHKLLMRKPIIFTMGSEMFQDIDRQVKLFEGACRRLGRPGLLITSANKRRKVSEDFFVDCIPYASVFPHASMILCHGGIGTIARCFTFGKPMIIAPLSYDHFDNGHLVEKLGAGYSRPYRSLTVSTLAAAILKIEQSPSIQTTCQDLAVKMKRDSGTAMVCDLIESLDPEHRKQSA